MMLLAVNGTIVSRVEDFDGLNASCERANVLGPGACIQRYEQE